MFDKQLLKIPGVKRAFAACACASAVEALVICAQCAALARAIVGIWEGGALAAQLLYIVAFAIFFILRKIVQNAQAAYIDAFAARTCEESESEYLGAMFAMGPAKAAQHGTAALASCFIDGMDSAETYLRLIIPRTIAVIVVPLVLLISMFAYDWVSAVIALIMYPFIIVFMRLIGLGAKAEASRRHGQFERMSNNFLDTAAGVDTLSAFGAGPAFSYSIFRASEKFRRLTMRTLRIAMLSSTVLDLFSTLAIAAVAIMMGFRMVEGTLAFLPALAILMMLPYYFQPIKDYGGDYHATLDGKTALDEVHGIIAESAGSIESPHLRGISLDLRTPCKVGVFGESGAGKTTLLNMLAGFAPADSCDIRIDGGSASALGSGAWRRRVAYIPQAPHIFHATLRENLTFYNPSASEEDVARAIEAAGLEPLVEQLPLGLGTQVGRGGRALSGGQAQRVAVARALLDPARDVWILDEPTAHLDIETEYDLKMRLLPLMQGKLVVIATHRLHWIDDMDICLFMENGRIVDAVEGDS